MHRPQFHRGLAGVAQGGGTEELQTDVMRFLAILSFCLVAIFALVQSIPLVPESAPEPIVEAVPEPEPLRPVEPKPEPVIERRPPPTPEPVAEVPRPSPPVFEPKPKPEPKPVPVKEPVIEKPASPPPAPVRVAQSPDASRGEKRRAPPVRRETPTPPQAPVAPVESAPIEAPQPEPQQQVGFTLRFDSDNALKALVAKSQVGLYALTPDKSWRLSFDRGRLTFWPASKPKQFHEMTSNTVPNDVVGAIRRVGVSNPAGGVTWGVTLPRNTTRQLNTILRSHKGGELVIEATGNLRLENGGGDSA